MAKENGIHQQFIGAIPESPEICIVGKDHCLPFPQFLHLEGDAVLQQFEVLLRNITAKQGACGITYGVVKAILIRFQEDVGISENRKQLIFIAVINRVRTVDPCFEDGATCFLGTLKSFLLPKRDIAGNQGVPAKFQFHEFILMQPLRGIAETYERAAFLYPGLKLVCDFFIRAILAVISG